MRIAKTELKWAGSGFRRVGCAAVSACKSARLRELEGENTKLKKLLAESMLDISALKGVFAVKR